MKQVELQISLFGTCIVKTSGLNAVEITGKKHQALFVLLATAPFGRRTRGYIQETLWGTACYDTGRQSLRRALSDIKRQFGDAFSKFITSTNSELTLDLSKVQFIGGPGQGEFMEGVDIKEARFLEWLQSVRAKPEQFFALYSPTSSNLIAQKVTPTIAVLPFRLVQGDKDDVVLADWLAEEVSRSLSRSNLLSVISHLSSRATSQTSIELEKVRKLLNIDYLVCGSIRVSAGRMILDADFVNARTGRILWTRNFSALTTHFLAADSDAVNEIVKSVGRMIASDTIKHVRGRELKNISDHQILLSGVCLMHEAKLNNFAKSREHILEATRRSPMAAETYAWLAEWYVMSVFNGWSTNLNADIQSAKDNAARALDLDPENSFALTIDGVVNNNLLQRLDIAENRFNAALEINPNESLSWLFSGTLDAYRDQGKSAIKKAERALELSPADPFSYFYEALISTAHFSAGNYEQALSFAESSQAKHHGHVSTLRAKLSALHYLDKKEDAALLGAELLRKQPDFNINNYLKNHPSANYQFGSRVAKALAASGIPTGD